MNAPNNKPGQPLNFAQMRTIKREVLEDLHPSWLQGAALSPEELHHHWPTDNSNSDPAALFEEFLRRLHDGEYEPTIERAVDPCEVLRAARRSATAGKEPALPAVGDEVFGFRLHHELGRGSFARVFLARQTGLASRPVVLKVPSISGNEPQTLAQLQHGQIVPIYSLHDDEHAGLRAVCMPYFGGATLGQVLQVAWAEGQPTRGEQIVQALRRTEAPRVGEMKGEAQSSLALLQGLSYVRAAAWIAARLAEALQHAHKRGVLHRDIKPSNILLSSDGEPMLLDFNLAQNIEQNEAQARLGGTVAYMAPEHLRAIVSHDPAQARMVDQRSDVYALGMVLYEMLAGRGPFEHKASYSPMRELIEAMAAERSQAVPSLRAVDRVSSPSSPRGSAIPWSLESIVRKCLAPDQAERYQSAGQLAEDLRRFLDDQPLKYAPELSWTERAAKWARRHPRLTSSSSVAVLAVMVLLAIGAVLLGIRESLQAAESRERKQAFQAATTRALCHVNTTTDLHEHLDRGLAECEQALGAYDVLTREDWQNGCDWRWLSPENRRALAEDVRELLLLLAWGRVKTAKEDRDTARGALALLDRAEAITGLDPSPALWRDRAAYLRLLEDPLQARKAEETARRMQPASARDHYQFAISHARQGTPEGYTRAVEGLDRALQLNPRHYWSLVQRGICHLELGNPILAAADFGNCIGLWPESAWGYFNRGCALDQSGNKAKAIADYSAALERDPKFVLALLNRGMARLEMRQPAEALADFEQAASLGRDDAFLHAGRGSALEALGRSDEADAAFAAAFERGPTAPPHVLTRIRWVYGFAVAARLPGKARDAFDAVLEAHPDHPEALYGRAMLLADQGQTRRALACFDRALQARPEFPAARRYRAILLARLGEFEKAYQDLEWCLSKESGAAYYAAACVGALEGKTKQALIYLKQAFRDGYGKDRADRDPDLSALRKDPAFARLLAAEPAGEIR